MSCHCDASIRLETPFLDLLYEAKQDEELDLRMRVATALILHHDELAIPAPGTVSPCDQPDPPWWCRFAHGHARVPKLDTVVRVSRRLILEQMVEKHDVGPTLELARLADPAIDASAFAVGLAASLPDEKVAAQVRRVATAVTSVTAGTMIPVPGSPLDEYCRRNPWDPFCWVIATAARGTVPRLLLGEVVLLHELCSCGILTQAVARASLNGLIREGGVIIDGFDVPVQTGLIWGSGYLRGAGIDMGLGARLLDVDGHTFGNLPPECEKPNPPRVPCWFIANAPRANLLLTAFVEAKVLSAEKAEVFRNRATRIYTIESVPLPE
ncbi:MAG: hypothetical protein ACFCGT_02375 [Sandaracinaceae bacterium]